MGFGGLAAEWSDSLVGSLGQSLLGLMVGWCAAAFVDLADSGCQNRISIMLVCGSLGRRVTLAISDDGLS